MNSDVQDPRRGILPVVRGSYTDQDAAAAIERYAAQGVSEDLALRTYSARLLGAESSPNRFSAGLPSPLPRLPNSWS